VGIIIGRKEKIKRENLKRETHGPALGMIGGRVYVPTRSQTPA
jgi:hypothetical protein